MVAAYALGLLPDADPADRALTYWAVDDVAASMQAAVAGRPMSARRSAMLATAS